VGVDVNKNFGAINFVSTTVGYESVEECGAFFSGGHFADGGFLFSATLMKSIRPPLVKS
jgi:hypothetical protein